MTRNVKTNSRKPTNRKTSYRVRIRTDVENYNAVERRWNSLAFASRRQLIDILRKDFSIPENEDFSLRRLGALEKRMRSFYDTHMEEFKTQHEDYEVALEKYAQDFQKYEEKLVKYEASNAPKKEKPTPPTEPVKPTIEPLSMLIIRPKSGYLQHQPQHNMRLAPKKNVKKRVHVISSGQIGSDAWDNAVLSVKKYIAHRHGALWVGCSTYGRLLTDEDGTIESTMDPIFDGHIVLDENIRLNDNFVINTLRMRPTLRWPLAGLSSTEGGETEVYMHPKNDLQYIAQTSNKLPRAKLASASLTIPNYSRNNLGQQDKTGELAQREHVYGGWIVEIEDDKVFHLRPIVMDKDGCFYDSFYTKRGKYVTKKFTPNGVEDAMGDTKGIVTGDSHFAVKPKTPEFQKKFGMCPKVKEATYGKKGIINQLGIPEVFMHDTFDGHSISHHNASKKMLLNILYREGLLDLEAELLNFTQTYAELLNSTNARFYDVASNHPEHLDRYLEEQRYLSKGGVVNINELIGHELFAKAVRNPSCNVIDMFTREHLTAEQCERLHFLKRDEDFYCEDIKVDMHGDMGANGSRGSDKQLHNLGIRCVVGHRHTPGISGLVWTVGTSTHLKLVYTKGLSSWVNTHCLIYKGGQRQLINIIDGRFAWNPVTHKADNRSFDSLAKAS